MDVQKVIFMLKAQDMDRAVVFYKDVMGLEVRSQSSVWSELVHGDATVALHGGGDGEHTPTGLGFTVADIEAACQEVARGGGRVVKAPLARPGEPIKLAQVADSEGNGFSLTQEVG